jgi:cell division protein ZapB
MPSGAIVRAGAILPERNNGSKPINRIASYSAAMKSEEDIIIAETDLQKLEGRVEELIKALDRLKDENKALRVSQDKLVAERAELIEKTELARTRVESMINRLKSMELSA